MPANTWTPTALASETRRWAGGGWRAVEAQHQVATLRLARGNLDDQRLLEDILDTAKPPAANEAGDLHWLLATPFRYRPPVGGSRFRGRTDPGVFYGAQDRPTACAEAGYWRLRFFLDSADLANEFATVSLTLFEFHAASDRALDLTAAAFADAQAALAHPADYSASQALAGQARAAGIDLIRYGSARLTDGVCLALLTPAPFGQVAQPYRNVHQTWQLTLLPPARVVWERELHAERWEFRYGNAA
ncbi:MAG: RES family NAD+ phosphorylase [Immundisolibacter sp.]|uniref:RES family NAD+ phosphorylase n=1 Tax=Immundisolibacter sp. TaxID=1934948 RepID=UPI003EE1B379